MRILAIETSCDETAIALVEASGGLRNPRFKILKNLVASQIKIHRPFGGIVPNLAKREHLRNLPILLKKTLNSSAKGVLQRRIRLRRRSALGGKSYILNSIDLIAVTIGPGLEPCLWTGINFAKELYKEFKIKNSPHQNFRFGTGQAKLKIIGTSHLEGHLYSFLLGMSLSSQLDRRALNSGNYLQNFFPAIALIISGGHTILLLMRDLTHYKKLGETRDDAVGEAFDKVARLLNLPYPGGPEIEKLAKYGSSTSIDFPRPMLNQKNYDFSFSGLKTAVLYYLRDQNLKTKSYKLKANVAASFQQAAFDVLISKTLRAAKEFKAKSILISGGVAANKTLQKQFKKEIKKHIPSSCLLVPSSSFCTDNAAMVAVAGYVNFLQNKKHRPRTKSSALVRGKLIAQSNLNLV